MLCAKTNRRLILLIAICVANSFLLCVFGGCSSMGNYSPLRPIENRIIFQPQPYPNGNWKPTDLAFEDVWIEANDKTKLHGWFLDCHNPKGVALYLHGTGGNVATESEFVHTLNQCHDLAVLAIDYRGYGRSEGKPSEEGILGDARAARQCLSKRTGVAEHEIVLIGFSLGGAVAIDLAAKDGARGLVVRSTFTSMPAVAARHAGWTLPQIDKPPVFVPV